MGGNNYLKRTAQVLAALLLACSQNSTEPSDPDARFSGVISFVAGDPSMQGAIGEIGVTLDPGHAVSEIRLFVTSETELLLRNADGSLEEASVADLKEDVRVEAWTTDVELRSSPPQYFATRLEVHVPSGEGSS